MAPRQYNMHEAKTQLSKLIELAEQGEEVVIARNGDPVATIAAYRPSSEPHRGRGAWRGKVDLTGFDEADAEIAREFEGADG